MSRRNIIITDDDRKRLEHLLASDFTEAIRSKSYLRDLRAELQRAKIVTSAEVPGDVITMESTVRLRDVDTGEVETYTLVYPDQANIAESKLSILAPIGTAILGYRVGDVVRWRVPSGRRRLRVEEVEYQPEREGDSFGGRNADCLSLARLAPRRATVASAST
ncbi:MAG: nucleoside diphosphate kinase regulator [Planctomycetaceae bacterium]|nr:nucleoside diphosphate kinase regulator [Planctomycetales bacterium]MCB9922270.1 nucleoside diphosphate kinase regulator [Planctomycetaceae bacterium]